MREKVKTLRYWYLQKNQVVEEGLAEPGQIASLKGRLLELISKIIHTTQYDLFKEEHQKLKDHQCAYESLE